MALDDETLLINPEWIDADYFKGFNILYTPVGEPWAANTLHFNDTVCLSAGFPKTVEIVQNLSKRIEILDISEFHKAEAGLTCLSLIFQDISH